MLCWLSTSFNVNVIFGSVVGDDNFAVSCKLCKSWMVKALALENSMIKQMAVMINCFVMAGDYFHIRGRTGRKTTFKKMIVLYVCVHEVTREFVP